MRIAVIHNLPAGGAKRALWEVSARLRTTHALDVYQLESPLNQFLSLDEFAGRVFETRAPTPVSPRSILPRKVVGDLTFYASLRSSFQRLAEAVNAGNYDVAFVHHCRYTQSPFVLPMLRLPSVYFCQEPPRALYEPQIPRPYGPRGGRGLRERLRRVKMRRLKSWDLENTAAATVILANSFYSAETIYRTYGRDAIVCQLGVDTRAFRRTGARRESMVVSVGALVPSKCHDLVIEAVALIALDRRPRLVIAAPMSTDDTLEQRYLSGIAAQRGVALEIVRLSATADVASLVSRALAVVFVPRLEPFGLVPIEAMACGTPTVGVAEGGVRETVRDCVTGLLCERSAQSCAAAIRRLAEDPELVERLGRAGIEEAKTHWTWDRTVASVERGFAAALDRGANDQRR